tara:strand:+ start:886 stop:1275 length:390 start_codon:yes stop_codon:yes gene_type:complete
MEKEKTQNEHAMESLHRKQRAAQRNRFVITTVVLGTFFLIMLGIGLAILGPGQHAPDINQEWKEILLLVLGAFLGSYSRIIDFWFNASDEDGVPGWSEPTSGPSGPNYCDNCGDKIEYNGKKESSGDDW